MAASVAAALVVALSVTGGREAGPGQRATSDLPALTTQTTQTTPESPPQTPKAPKTRAVPPAASAAPSATALGSPVPPARVPADGSVARSVERGASLRLATSPARLDEVAQGVVQTTDGVGGFVRNSAVDSRPGRGGGASFELEIPTQRLQTALARLSQLASVRSRRESSTDVTEQVTFARNRVAARRVERTALLKQLAAAKSLEETARIRARLRSIEARLREANASRAALRRRTTYSAVAVEIITQRARTDTGAAAWTPRDALGDAVRVLEVAAGVALVALAVLLPLTLLLALLWPIGHLLQRRWREQALNHSTNPTNAN